MILADVHAHTSASHGADTLEAMYASAAAAGLEWFGISEHSPLPEGFACPLYTGDLAAEFPALAQKTLALAAGSSSPRLLLGLELDWLPSRRQYMSDLCQSQPFDYVLGSLHFLDGISVGSDRSWPPDMPDTARRERYLAHYLEMANMAASGLINVAAHPDFIKLRNYKSFTAWLETAEAQDAVSKALATMAGYGVAMEVSSAGIARDFAEPYPGPAIMRLAREAGVMISFASDAHKAGHVARNFDALAAYARSFGFSSNVVFVQEKPVFMNF